MPRIEIDDVTLHYQQSGNGPDVVLVHAFTSNLSVWMLINLVETLAANFRVTAYDLRGHGASGVPRRGYTSADMARDFNGLHARLGLGRAWLVGHSFGGVIGMHAALLYPRHVAGVILSDTYFPGLAHLEPNMPRSGPWQDLRGDLARCGIEIGETVDFGALFQQMSALTPDELEAIKREMGPPALRWLSQLTQLANTSAAEEAFQPAGLTEEKIRTIQQPIIALYDEHTPFTATRDWLEANLADCTVDVVPGAKHLAPLQSSAEFVARVDGHLRQRRREPT